MAQSDRVAGHSGQSGRLSCVVPAGVRPELADASPHPQIEAAFAQARSTLEKLQMPLADAVSDPDQRALVEQLQAELSALKQLLARDLAAALGLSLGFNSLDGD